MRLGLVGCGAIGSEIVAFAAQEPGIKAVLMWDVDQARAQALAQRTSKARLTAPQELLGECDFFVEAASQDAAREWLPRAVDAGRSLLTMSLGALADDAFRSRLVERARATGARIYLPSGAVCGVDGLKAGALAGLKSVTLVTTKPPEALGILTDQWTVVFDGTAREAVHRFPQNVNVAAVLAIAGLGFDATRVQVVADPLATRNQHKIIIEGAFGRLRVEVENLPSPTNPKTSHLASLSAIATLKRLLDPVQLGA
jgi:aspartate dehydrogenase